MAPILRFPEDFDDFAWEVEAKGVYTLDVVRSDGQVRRVTFAVTARLAQDIESEILHQGFFAEQRLVVLKQLTRDEMEAAVARLGDSFLD